MHELWGSRASPGSCAGHACVAALPAAGAGPGLVPQPGAQTHRGAARGARRQRQRPPLLLLLQPAWGRALYQAAAAAACSLVLRGRSSATVWQGPGRRRGRKHPLLTAAAAAQTLLQEPACCRCCWCRCLPRLLLHSCWCRWRDCQRLALMRAPMLPAHKEADSSSTVAGLRHRCQRICFLNDSVLLCCFFPDVST